MDDYGDMLLRTACLLLKDRQSAEEAVQDTFIQAYAKMNQLQDPGTVKGLAHSHRSQPLPHEATDLELA